MDDAAADRAAKAHTLQLHWRQQVEDLFDSYADTFEEHLQGRLAYDIPAEIEGSLLACMGDCAFSSTAAVDLGCGTGLCGQRLRARCAGRLLGCDLSRGMLEVAEQKAGVYDELKQCDVARYLRKFVPAGGADLLVAADVLIYLHDLMDLFAAAALAMSTGGMFALSTETATAEETGWNPGDPDRSVGPGYVERPSERIAQCNAYLEWAAGIAGFHVVQHKDVTVRTDGQCAENCKPRPVPGSVYVLRKL